MPWTGGFELATELEREITSVRQLFAARRYREALELSNDLVTAHPESMEAYFRRAFVLEAMKQPRAAIDDLTTAIGICGSEPALFYFRGMWRIELGLLDAGIVDMGQTIALERQLQSVYYVNSARLCRAIAYHLRGDAELSLLELDGAFSGLIRSPFRRDSISIPEWAIESCRTERSNASEYADQREYRDASSLSLTQTV